jgi:hypothetical protein
MRALILALALALCTPLAYAGDMVAKDGEDTVRLSELPCPVDVLKVLPQGTRGHYRAAFVQFQGKSYDACWTKYGQSAHLVYPDGDQGLIPFSDFKQDVGV